MAKGLDLNMSTIQNLSPLHFDHKLGFFGDYESKDEIIKITEVKDLSIFQIVKFKKSSIDINQVSFNNLKLPTKSLTVSSDNITRILWSGPDTWLIVSKDKILSENIYNNFRDDDFAVTDISHSRAVIEISGAKSKDVLKKGSPINFNDNIFKQNNCANTTYNGINIIIDFISEKPDCFNLLALRSFGGSFYHSITDSCLEYGYEAI